MAENESGSEKTEQPTAKKLSDARQKGQIAKSTDLNGAFILLAGLLLLYVYGEGIHVRLVDFTKSSFNEIGEVDLTRENFFLDSVKWIELIVVLTIPFMLVLTILTLVVTIFQSGFMWTLKPMLEPDFKKFLNPIAGIIKMFKRDNWIKLLMSMAKVLLISGVAYWVIGANAGAFASIALYDVNAIFNVSASLTMELGIKMALAMLILAIIDYQYQRFSNTEQLKMTKEEVKEETKSMEGDPKVRQRRRSIQMRLARERMMKNVADADVVVTNPVELAIALKYDEELGDSPVVVAKGARLMAQRIKEIAYTSEVPVVEHKPMARALYEAVEVGESIPERLYKGVAEILAYVWEANKTRRRRRRAS